ncbi:uncharacterized protein LOC134833607 [Culicoides brevitarsis]|uniref:uncharacterized protein LOC134833607 n=1 Tax=Culicoides brevitarsis TaxID=469753 RepID=UPI00307C84FB
MNDSFGGGGFNPNTTASGAGGETQKDGILPVCVRQLLLVDDEVKMFNFSYAMVSLVAIVRKIDYTSTKITYTLEDHTGRIEAHYWLDDENSKHPKMTQNAYAHVVGSLRKVSDQNVIIVYNAEEVEKINEVTTHLLEVLFTRFKAEKFSQPGGAVTKINSGGLGAFTNGGTNGVSTHQPMETSQSGGGQAAHGMSGKNALILQHISINNGANGGAGITRDELYAKFPKIPKSEVDDVISVLVDEGHIYSTVSSDNFQTVE